MSLKKVGSPLKVFKRVRFRVTRVTPEIKLCITLVTLTLINRIPNLEGRPQPVDHGLGMWVTNQSCKMTPLLAVSDAHAQLNNLLYTAE